MKRLLVFLLPVLIISDTYIYKPIPPVSSGYQVDQVDTGWSNNGVLDCSYYDPRGVIRTDNNQTTYGHYAYPCVGSDCTDASTMFAFFSVSSIDDPTKFNYDYSNGVPDITMNLLSPLQCQVYYVNNIVVGLHDRNVTCDSVSTVDMDGNGYCVCKDGYIPSSSSVSSCDPLPQNRTKEYCQTLQSQAIVDAQDAAFAKLPTDYNSTGSSAVYFSAISQDYQCTEDAALSYGAYIGKLDLNNTSIDSIAVSYVSCARVCQVVAVVKYPDSGTGDTGSGDTGNGGTGDTGGGTGGTGGGGSGGTGDTGNGGTGDTGGGTGGTGDTGGGTGDTGDTGSGGSGTGDTGGGSGSGDTGAGTGGTGDATVDMTETNDLLRDILDAGGESEAQSSMSYLDNMTQFLDALSQSADNIQHSYSDLQSALDGTYTTNFSTSSQCTITFSPFGSTIDVDMCKWSYIVRPWVVFITTLFLLYYLIRLHVYLFVHLIRR